MMNAYKNSLNQITFVLYSIKEAEIKCVYFLNLDSCK